MLWHLTQDDWDDKDEWEDDIRDFLSYEQKRMDLIAHMATSAPSWCLSMKFAALMKTFNNQWSLLDNIARFQEIRRGQINISYDGYGEIDIPHANVGVHAFYTILENLIRNAARYGDPDKWR